MKCKENISQAPVTSGDSDAGMRDICDSAGRKFIIRRMTPDDAAAGAYIEKECFSEPWSEAVYHATLLLGYAYYFLAVDEAGEVIGTTGLQVIAGEGEITNVAVIPSRRGRRIAHALLETALECGSGLGVTDYTLEVRAGNIPAIRLYESFGFAEEGRRKNFYTSPQEDALILWLRNVS